MFHALLYLFIAVFGIGSYSFALRNVHLGNYRPNVFSRGVWCLLAINTLAGVFFSHSSAASLLLAGVLTVGSVLMFGFSLPNGRREFGTLEIICSGLLVASAVVWLAFRAPLVNVGLSLLAHFVGALPTYREVWRRPQSESKVFWFLFFVCSLLSVIASYGTTFLQQLVPIYYSFLDGSMFLLSLRRGPKP